MKKSFLTSLIVAFLAMMAASFANADEAIKGTVARHGSLSQAMDDAGCLQSWLPVVMVNNNLLNEDLTHLRAGAEFDMPNCCSRRAPTELLRRARRELNLREQTLRSSEIEADNKKLSTENVALAATNKQLKSSVDAWRSQYFDLQSRLRTLEKQLHRQGNWRGGWADFSLGAIAGVIFASVLGLFFWREVRKRCEITARHRIERQGLTEFDFELIDEPRKRRCPDCGDPITEENVARHMMRTHPGKCFRDEPLPFMVKLSRTA